MFIYDTKSKTYVECDRLKVTENNHEVMGQQFMVEAFPVESNEGFTIKWFDTSKEALAFMEKVLNEGKFK